MKKWFKSSRTVKNSAQAGDAALAFYFEGDESCVLEINTQENFPFTQIYGEYHTLYLWGVPKGLKEIPLIPKSSLSTSLESMKFTREEISLYTHFIFNNPTLQFSKYGGKVLRRVYRINDLDRNQIVTGYF